MMLALMLALPAMADGDEQQGPTVVAKGLDNPRGLAIADDGSIYVAEAGKGGDGPCVKGPEGGEECYGYTGAVTRISAGSQERVATGLPLRAAEGGNSASGPHDVAFQGDDWYTIVGPGALEIRSKLGDDTVVGHIVHLKGGDDYKSFADVAAYEAEANPDGDALESNPYSIVSLSDGGFVVADAAANALFKVSAGGDVSTLAVFPERPVTGPDGMEMPMDSVPNAVTVGPDGNY